MIRINHPLIPLGLFDGALIAAWHESAAEDFAGLVGGTGLFGIESVARLPELFELPVFRVSFFINLCGLILNAKCATRAALKNCLKSNCRVA